MRFAVGQDVTAKYLATSAGARCPGKYFSGKIVKVNADGTYNIRYDDGDHENAVVEKFIKASEAEGTAPSKRPGKRPAPSEEETAPEPAMVEVQAAAARRAGKRRVAEPEAIDVDEEDDDVQMLDGSINTVPAAPTEDDGDDVQEVDGDGDGVSSRTVVPVEPTEEEADGDVQITGRSGELVRCRVVKAWDLSALCG